MMLADQAAIAKPASLPRRGPRGRRIDPHGYDAGKKINGKKRHILVDTIGLLLHAIVHPADIQDRDGGVLVPRALFGNFPFPRKLFADGGYQGPIFCEARKKVLPGLVTEIVKRSDTAKGFEVLPRRWVARSVSKIGQGLGVPQPKGPRFFAHRLHPPHARKAMQSRMMSQRRWVCFNLCSKDFGATVLLLFALGFVQAWNQSFG